MNNSILEALLVFVCSLSSLAQPFACSVAGDDCNDGDDIKCQAAIRTYLTVELEHNSLYVSIDCRCTRSSAEEHHVHASKCLITSAIWCYVSAIHLQTIAALRLCCL
jgi:hypothetical protein